MRINIKAWCRYKEFYSLEITEEYLKRLNEWAHERYPDAKFEDITAEDVYAVFGCRGEWLDKFDTYLDEHYKLGDFIEECVRGDVWESYEDNEYYEMEDWETSVEFDTLAEREHFEGPDDTE